MSTTVALDQLQSELQSEADNIDIEDFITCVNDPSNTVVGKRQQTQTPQPKVRLNKVQLTFRLASGKQSAPPLVLPVQKKQFYFTIDSNVVHHVCRGANALTIALSHEKRKVEVGSKIVLAPHLDFTVVIVRRKKNPLHPDVKEILENIEARWTVTKPHRMPRRLNGLQSYWIKATDDYTGESATPTVMLPSMTIQFGHFDAYTTAFANNAVDPHACSTMRMELRVRSDVLPQMQAFSDALRALVRKVPGFASMSDAQFDRLFRPVVKHCNGPMRDKYDPLVRVKFRQDVKVFKRIGNSNSVSEGDYTDLGVHKQVTVIPEITGLFASDRFIGITLTAKQILIEEPEYQPKADFAFMNVGAFRKKRKR
ncbi:hypothetical protein OAM67_00525 [bacterium]|nr:hypothetical protein [bacterium]